MAAKTFSLINFFWRWLFAFVLVGLTYNPTDFSLYRWVSDVLPDFSAITPLLAISSLLLLIGWVMYLRATLRSLGLIGTLLAVALVAALVWWAFDMGWLDRGNQQVLAWVGIVFVSLILGAGMSWSHIRRRLSGQLDVDDHDGDN
ncbi:MAG TPA: hypothetical protein DCY55_01465 [Gammaproteobacteria bacterium]|jgi:hypothetical protein|nr:hypothetical protein [Pseudomonadota bacterium]HAY44934.1 hypothetical protein [Gammaproteobacteria bacterium]